jgi:hypothetical protein
MNSAYNINLYIKGKFSGSLECSLYTGLTVVWSIHLNKSIGGSGISILHTQELHKVHV